MARNHAAQTETATDDQVTEGHSETDEVPATEQVTETAAEAAAAPPKETKAEAFTRIAKRRMGNALSDIKLIEGLASKTNYEYEEAHYTKMVAALRKQVDELEAVFIAGGKQAAASGFEF